MNTAKLLEIYEYANKIAYRFERLRYLRRDLVHDVILSLLEEPERLNDIQYIKSYIFRSMKWKRNDLHKSPYSQRTDNFIDKPIDALEGHTENTTWLDLREEKVIHCSECLTDLHIVKEHISSKEFSKGNTRDIFHLMLQGFKPEEIAKKLNITQHAVNQSVCNTRKKLNKHFRK
jgi:RNA polymerase sigma factor (sigma-70 family)